MHALWVAAFRRPAPASCTGGLGALCSAARDFSLHMCLVHPLVEAIRHSSILGQVSRLTSHVQASSRSRNSREPRLWEHSTSSPSSTQRVSPYRSDGLISHVSTRPAPQRMPQGSRRLRRVGGPEWSGERAIPEVGSAAGASTNSPLCSSGLGIWPCRSSWFRWICCSF